MNLWILNKLFPSWNKPPHVEIVEMGEGSRQLVKDTDEGKLFLQIATNHCPDCGGDGFYEGPSGGLSTNIKCANPECGSEFNVTPMIGIADRIGKR